ncbi:hypothetical protein GF312_13755 [Candidatus Poribacteria bacterium]|nr:hypothetical protein [Candidatus Poribacteria bacterium]
MMNKSLVIFVGLIAVGIIVVSILTYMELQEIEKEAEILGKSFCQSKGLTYVYGATCTALSPIAKVHCKDKLGQITEYKIACEED